MAASIPPIGWRAAHLTALWGYGVSQPVFSLLEGNPEFLVVRGTTRLELTILALAVAFLPPLVAIGLQALVGVFSSTVAGVIHVLTLWMFGALAGLQLLQLFDPAREVALLVPVVVSYVFVLAYLRWDAIRSFLSVSVLLPVAGLVLFVVTVPLAIDDREGAQVTVDSRTPVVLLVLDEFSVSSLLKPDGTLDAVRYPGFARLARGATWYPRATTVADHTTLALPAILTGQLPDSDDLPTLADHPENLFTLLGESYDFQAREQLTRLCPVRYCPESRIAAPLADRFRGLVFDVGVGFLHGVLPTSLRGELPPIGDRWGGFGDEAGADARQRLLGARTSRQVDLAVERDERRPRAEFDAFLRTFDGAEADRTLYFLHLLLPHSPWHILPSGREYGNAGTIDGTHDGWNRWRNIPWLVDQELQRYLLQVGYTDRLVGRLLDTLESTGVYDRALIVVTGDHGVSFRPGGWRRLVTADNAAEVAGVPFFVKYPGQRDGRIDTRAATTIDIVPTIADVIGVTLPWNVDGQSLRGRPVERKANVVRRGGPAFSTELDAVTHGIRRVAARNAALFGTGAQSLYRVGSHAELLGRRVTAMPRAVASGSAVRFEGETLLRTVDLGSVFIPSRIAGEIENPPSESKDLAIAVNGRIAAVTRRYTLDGREWFAALAPEHAFRNGSNDVDVYEIDTASRRLRLVLLGGTARSAATYALALDDSAIVHPTGRRAILGAGQIDGRVESWVEDQGTVQIRGWAADLRRDLLPDQILLFDGQDLLYAGETTIVRWDVDTISGHEGVSRAGWVVTLPSANLDVNRVRVFAVRGNSGSELVWSAPRRALAG